MADATEYGSKPFAIQPWLSTISVMQQTVLLSAIRGPDGFAKGHPVKPLIRWYRRCVLVSAMERCILENPWEGGGGDFTGPSFSMNPEVLSEEWKYNFIADEYERIVSGFLRARDEMTHHYFAHAMHAFQVLGYKHPDLEVRGFWNRVYIRCVDAHHLRPETEEDMDKRLGDNEADWRARSEPSGSCST